MDELNIFNNEELLEIYEKVDQEVNHLKDSIIIEEEEEPKNEQS